MIWVFLQLRHPCLRDVDRLLLRIIFCDSVSCLVSTSDDVLHVLISESTHQTEEEISFRQSPRQLLLSWKVFHEQFILHSIFIQILHRYLLIARYFHVVDFVLSEKHLGFAEDITHETEFCAMHRWKKHVHYTKFEKFSTPLPCQVRYL